MNAEYNLNASFVYITVAILHVQLICLQPSFTMLPPGGYNHILQSVVITSVHSCVTVVTKRFHDLCNFCYHLRRH